MKKVTQYTIKEACQIIGVDLPEEYTDIADEVLSNIAMSVNSLSTGGGFLLAGKNKEDRARTLESALKKNPKVVFYGKASRKLEALQNVPHIELQDSYDAMVLLSAHTRKKLGLKVVGVTGSLGKTTTKEIVHSVLSQSFVASKNYGNRNNTKGIFNSLQSVNEDVQFYVQEFGVAIGKRSMESKVNACLPNAAIITNISEPHIDDLGSKENILKEKLKLVTEMEEGSPAFLNYDDEMLKEVKLEKHPIISFAIENKEADYYAENIQFIEDYITFDAVHAGRRTPIVLHSRGRHNVGNALVAMAVGEWFGMSVDEIVRGIDAFRSEGIRQSLVNIGGYRVYVDCYNTAPISLLGSVDVLERIEVEKGGKRIAVVGDIVRLGTEEERLHIEVGEKIARSTLDFVLCFGNKNAKLLADTIRKNGKAALYTDDRDELNTWMRGLITRKDVTLVKGPVARLLSKSIDQVFGTSYHVSSEHHEVIVENDYKCDILFEKEDHSKKTAALLQYNGKDAEHMVPARFQNVDVFSIFERCFKNNKELRKVVVPEPIYNISDEAFAGCVELKEVVLPSTMMVIGAKAFAGCDSLEEFVIPEGVIEVGEEAFSGCKNLKKVTLPESIGHIGEEAFKGCENIVLCCEKNSYSEEYAKNHNLAVCKK